MLLRRGGLYPPGIVGHSPGIAPPYDPDRARQLLAAAGYPGGAGFPQLHALGPRGPRWQRTNEYLQAQWRETLGVDIQWQMLEWAEYLHRRDSDRAQMFRLGWIADYPDPDTFLRVFVLSRTAWRHDPYLELVEQARRSQDQEERMRLYAQAERILVDEAPLLPLTYGRWHVLMKPWLRSYPISVTRDLFWKDVVIEPH